ncbi:MAG: signal peptidase I [Mogibacterium sp.]|nr:signal peptidase I [Mogibacterium sp.]
MSEFIKSLIKDIIIALILAGIVLYFIRPTIVKQTSMQPTMNPNDYIIMYKQAYRSEGPERGDIIIFQSDLTDSEGNEKLLIKRAIGLPGDTITVRDDQVWINGELLEEDYLSDDPSNGSGPADIVDMTIPENEYFVMGDHRAVSVDSRYEEIGLVSRDQIKGKAVLRLFPFDRIRRF